MSEKYSSSKCEWCKYNENRCTTDEIVKSCDFKSLKMDKDAILTRAKEEYAIISKLKDDLKLEKDNKKVEVMAMDASDRLGGVTIMMRVLDEKFGMDRAEIMKQIGMQKVSMMDSLKLGTKLAFFKNQIAKTGDTKKSHEREYIPKK